VTERLRRAAGAADGGIAEGENPKELTGGEKVASVSLKKTCEDRPDAIGSA
jgi:hypothetical protein